MGAPGNVLDRDVTTDSANVAQARLTMKSYARRVRRAAVLGAGVMGAQIAAHLANAGIRVWLYELAADGTDKNADANKALQALAKLKPSPLATENVHNLIQPANYDTDLEKLKACDLVMEVISERIDWKHDLFNKVMPHLNDKAILATNTSGLSVHAVGEVLPHELRRRFCGVHFFNPPRYMHLLELIPHSETEPEILQVLEGFLTTTLGKGVIYAKDTPSFIGNRVGVFSLLAVIHHAQRLGLPFDLVDKLTGQGIGRPKSATFRTADVVGLDTFAHVVNSMTDTLGDDPWHTYYRVPVWATLLIEKGALGQKTRAGIYKKDGKELHVLDLELQDYRRVQSALDDEVRKILLMRDPGEKYEALLACAHPQADFLLSIFLDLFHFCAYHLEHIAHTARDIDLALRWGYGWNMGPFEIWQAVGWQRVAQHIADKLAKGQMMSAVPLPDWVSESGRQGVHGPEGSWSADEARWVARSTHPVYERQAFPERVIGETRPATETLVDNDAVRLWHSGDDIAVLSFKTKMHTITGEVLKGTRQAIKAAESDFKALVLWQSQAPFCAGANLLEVSSAVKSGQLDAVQHVIEDFQRTTMLLKHSAVPTVAAVQGLALGGGCELLMHCDRVVAALESYVGLVEVGVGLIPAGGGCKELVLRAAGEARGDDLFPFIARYFEQVAMAKVSTSAEEARGFGYLRGADKLVFNLHELLYVAKQEAVALYESGYRPPLPRHDIPVAGAAAAATLQARLFNMVKGGFISEHDYEISRRLAEIFCGGEVDPGSLVSDQWLLKLEIDAFMALIETQKTQQRIQYMLENGKPLRN